MLVRTRTNSTDKDRISGVGKTSLALRCSTGKFSEAALTTVGTALFTKEIEYMGGTIKLNVSIRAASLDCQ
jgi:GTPase SAR1 family protein